MNNQKRMKIALRGSFARVKATIKAARQINADRVVPVILNAEAEAIWIIEQLAKNPAGVFEMREQQRETELQLITI